MVFCCLMTLYNTRIVRIFLVSAQYNIPLYLLKYNKHNLEKERGPSEGWTQWESRLKDEGTAFVEWRRGHPGLSWVRGAVYTFIHVSPDICWVLQSVQFQGDRVHRWWAGVNGAGTPGAISQLPDSNSGPELEDSSGAICSHSGSSRVPRLP